MISDNLAEDEALYPFETCLSIGPNCGLPIGVPFLCQITLSNRGDVHLIQNTTPQQLIVTLTITQRERQSGDDSRE